MKYYPDSYQFIKITSESTEPVVKLFAVWTGGYLNGDAWQMNSGVTDVVETENHYEVHGYSGSVYVISKQSARMSDYGSSVLNRVIKNAKIEGIVVERISLEDVCTNAKC